MAKSGKGTSFIVSKIFIDTNILVYTLDGRDRAKQAKAREIVSAIASKHLPVISTQVVKEFFVVATTKLKTEAITAKQIVHNFHNMEVVANDLDLIEQAIDIHLLSQISFWDALIVAAAEKANCEYIFSEDLNDGQLYRGIKIVDPFKEEQSVKV